MCVFRFALHFYIVTVASSSKDVKDVGYVIVRVAFLIILHMLITLSPEL